ncbi:hypothetical protein N7492_007677 [Penicillium capsulatum]|uniref:Fungal N-terminal domain-containing protein n=1 Tax=Penicillium capsulatum TaxID=69766 RepID=A0A9W9I4F5_9EURO|nr:hypothetical protein N7492_007677 [Penicillium capsulatum]KAJ6117511.1 hypothetical protein N7512_007236 [Penicillium capsulatum]
MSFGYSVGDIIVCSKIAYRLFTAVTEGRKAAPRDLKGLEDVLFGLYCALDHLQKAHDNILTRIAQRPGSDAAKTKQQLEYMITSCRQTLEELDDVTAKYREAARPTPDTHNIAGNTLSGPFKSQVKNQWMRVWWDLRGDSLSKYRQKLQSHTDAINLLLGTLIWYKLCLLW